MRASKRETRTEVTVVIIERGAKWPSNVDELRRNAPESVVLAQSPDESPDDFAARVQSRLARLESSDRVVRSAVLAAGPATGTEMVAARRRMAHALRWLRVDDEIGSESWARVPLAFTGGGASACAAGSGAPA